MDDETKGNNTTSGRPTDDAARPTPTAGSPVATPAAVPPPPGERTGGTGWSTQPPVATPVTSAFGTPAAPSDESATTTTSAAPKRRRGGMLLTGLAIGAILGGGAGAAVTTVLDDDGTDTTATRSSLDTDSNSDDNQATPAATSDVQQVAAAVLPSVVSISVGGVFGETGGTGVIISSDGEILTNNHVVAGTSQSGFPGQGQMQETTVHVTFSDGTTAEADVVGTDPVTDLAVIKARDVSNLQPAELGSSTDLTVGQQVVAIGSPLGLDGTVTSGIVSALDRPVATDDPSQSGASSVIDAVQTDAPINPGNSGGPLVNMDGQVVGVNSVILTAGTNSGSIGLGFAIPIDQVKPIVEELLDNGKATHARLGIGVGDPEDGTRGASIASVEDGSSAAAAGLQEGDIITRMDDRVISDATSLIAAARSHRPGDTVEIAYLRDGDEHTTDVTLGSDAQTT